MKIFKDIFNETFNIFSILIYTISFILALVIFLLLDNNILSALKDAMLVDICIIVMIMFGCYVDKFKN